MKFHQKEVTNEERITLAAYRFESSKKRESLHKTNKHIGLTKFKPNESVPTATGLVNPSKANKVTREVKCIFCNSNHLTENCQDTSIS